MIWLLFTIFAHDPITTKITWNREISRIVERRCVNCHGSGTSVELNTYEWARPWAKAIRDQVLQRKMPPWGAVKGVGDFQNDASLTALERETITQWVEGGAPEGEGPARVLHAHPIAEPAVRWNLSVTSQRPLKLNRATSLTALEPEAPMEVTAFLPDGNIERLIWIRDAQADYKRAYIFREPIALPAGTEIRIFGTGRCLMQGLMQGHADRVR